MTKYKIIEKLESGRRLYISNGVCYWDDCSLENLSGVREMINGGVLSLAIAETSGGKISKWVVNSGGKVKKEKSFIGTATKISSRSSTICPDHAPDCRCSDCLLWWANMGPDGERPDAPGAFGPFEIHEIEDFCRKKNLRIFW